MLRDCSFRLAPPSQWISNSKAPFLSRRNDQMQNGEPRTQLFYDQQCVKLYLLWINFAQYLLNVYVAQPIGFLFTSDLQEFSFKCSSEMRDLEKLWQRKRPGHWILKTGKCPKEMSIRVQEVSQIMFGCCYCCFRCKKWLTFIILHQCDYLNSKSSLNLIEI